MAQRAAAVFAQLTDSRPIEPGAVVFDAAVVLGGSMAGLLAARVLADHAEQVVVVERDEPGAGARPRPGVPQGAQAHVLLPAGLVQLDRFFPGFSEEAVAAGALPAPAAARRTYADGVLKVPGADAHMITGSRPFLEALVRKRVLALPNVRQVVGRVTGLGFSAGAVTEVRHETAAGTQTLAADFVVDAMGRGSRLGDWLEKAGWERPPTTRVRIDLNYATAVLRRTEDQPDVNPVLSTHEPGTTEAGVAAGAMCRIEDDRWMVLLSGYVDDRPGHTPEDLVRVCKTELPGDFATAVTHEVLGLSTYHLADSRRRDFHRLARMPARLVAVGDSAASFNPIYAQGITSAALQASALSRYLRSGPDPAAPARGFFALQRVVVDAAWTITAGADLALPHVTGPRPRGFALRHRAAREVVRASVHDPEISRRFEEVIFLLEHPSRLARPGTLLRSVLVNRRHDRARTRRE